MYNRIYPYAHRSAGAITVTGGTQVVFNTAGVCLGAIGYDSDKLYFEVEVDAMTAAITIGVAGADQNFGAEIGSLAYNSYGYRQSGLTIPAGATVSSFTVGDIIGVALDLSAGTMFVSKNGVWQNSADPAAGTGAVLTGLSGVYFPAVYGTTSGDQVTFKFDTADLTYSIPTGFNAMDDDGRICYTYAIEEFRSYPALNRGCWWNTPDSFSNAAHYFGSRAAGSSYKLFVWIDELWLSPSVAVLEAYARFDKSSGPYTVCNASVGFNAAINSVAPTSYSEAEALSVTTMVDWDAIPSWNLAPALRSSPDIQNAVEAVTDLTGWAAGNPIQLIVKDNSSDTGANRSIDNLRRGGALNDQTHIWIKYRSGVLTHEVGREEQLSVADVVDGSTSPAGLVTDGIGIGDDIDAPLPAHGKPIEDIGLGDEIIADHLVELVQEDVGFNDSTEAMSLSPVTEDNAGLNDFIDSYILAVGTEESVGISDDIDADTDANFGFSETEHRHEVDQAEIDVTQAPHITSGFEVAGPAITAQIGGIQAGFEIAGPSITAQIAHSKMITAGFGVPGPAITASISQDNAVSAGFSVAGPSITATIIKENKMIAGFSVPGPAIIAQIAGATDMAAGFEVAGPSIKANIRQESRFGILEHTRC